MSNARPAAMQEVLSSTWAGLDPIPLGSIATDPTWGEVLARGDHPSGRVDPGSKS